MILAKIGQSWIVKLDVTPTIVPIVSVFGTQEPRNQVNDRFSFALQRTVATCCRIQCLCAYHDRTAW